jgi:hypothetical protein
MDKIKDRNSMFSPPLIEGEQVVYVPRGEGIESVDVPGFGIFRPGEPVTLAPDKAKALLESSPKHFKRYEQPPEQPPEALPESPIEAESQEDKAPQKSRPLNIKKKRSE